MSFEQLKRELLVRLRREMFMVEEGSETDQAFRRGWNARAQSLIVDLSFDTTDTGGPP